MVNLTGIGYEEHSHKGMGKKEAKHYNKPDKSNFYIHLEQTISI